MPAQIPHAVSLASAPHFAKFNGRTLSAVLSLGLFILLLFAGARPSPAASPATPGDAAKATANAEKSQMSILQAIVLGAIEGLTEYLPVSSTGHLLLTERVMEIGTTKGGHEENSDNKDAADAYAICIQAGAIVAVLGLYRRRVSQMIQGLLGKDPDGLRLVVNILAGFVPAAVIGLLLNKTIKAYLFGIWPVIIAWFVGGVAILVVTSRQRRRRGGNFRRSRRGGDLTSLTVQTALIIGFAQCIAMWPGVSRSLITIVGGLAVGLSLSAAVEFSFLLGVVTLGAATAYDALKHGALMLHTFHATALLVGLISAFIFAVISVKWMVSYLNRHDLSVFGYYRVFIALLTAAAVIFGVF